MKQCGAVIVFSTGIDKKEAEQMLKQLMEKMNDNGIYMLDRQPRVHEFDPEYGSPVFYIP